MIAPSPGPLSKHFGKYAREAFNGDLHTLNEDDDVVEVEDIVDDDDVVEIAGDDADDDDVVEVEDAADDDVVVVDDEVAGDDEVARGVTDEITDAVTVATDEITDAGDAGGAVYYKNARIEYDFEDMRKENGVYFLPLKTPVMIQTPVVRLAKPLQGDSTVLHVLDNFARFVNSHDDSVLRVTKENKGSWFKKYIEDSSLEAGFKSFLDSNTLKVKISEDLASFDNDGTFIGNDFCTPAEVVCILKISGIWFGSMEFGSIMSLVQVQLVKPPKCSIKTSREHVNYSDEFE